MSLMSKWTVKPLGQREQHSQEQEASWNDTGFDVKLRGTRVSISMSFDSVRAAREFFVSARNAWTTGGIGIMRGR